MIRVRIEDVERQARHRPEGYVSDVLGRGRVADGWVEWDEATWYELAARYGSAEDDLPGLGRMVAGFSWALARWAAAGFAVVEEAEYRRRRAACEACPEWCTGPVPRCRLCGCYALKLWLSTEKCPLKKW
jgi:hypothetical protein